MKLLINSIYQATEGEGIHIGQPQVFVRFQGCNIGCLNCDSKDTWDFKKDEMRLSLDQVISNVKTESKNGLIQRVSITGGDPLHPQHEQGLLELVKELKARRFWINIEAAGTRVVSSIFDSLDFISFDLKTPSTGVRTPIENIIQLSEKFPQKFQIKAVVESREDFDYCLSQYQKIEKKIGKINFPWCLTPSYNVEESFPSERFHQIIQWNMNEGGFFRVIGQQHKWIYGPTRKNV
jgi:7-carboxy-7-deazaguanine synthase